MTDPKTQYEIIIEIGDIYKMMNTLTENYVTVIKIEGRVIMYCACDKNGVITQNAGVFGMLNEHFLDSFKIVKNDFVYESMVDEEKQDADIRERYGFCPYHMIDFSDNVYLNAIKKLEIDIFNLRESLKLSQELNASYEKTIKEYRDNEGNERAN